MVNSVDFVFSFWIVGDFVVDMYECSFDFVQPFQSLLKCLANVVCLQDLHVLGQYNVNLDEKVSSKVEGTYSVNPRHLWMVI